MGKATKEAKKLGEKAVQAYMRKAAALSAPVSSYVHPGDRGDAYDPDPAVRKLSWVESEGRFLGKSRTVSGGITPGQLALWQETARFDPDPAVREALWSAIREVTEAAR